MLLGLVGLAAGALLVWGGLALWRGDEEARGRRVTTEATVKEKVIRQTRPSLGGLETYYVQCLFTNDVDEAQFVEFKVPAAAWQELEKGKSVRFTWLPGQTNTIRLGGNWGHELRALLGAFLAFFGILIAVVFLLGSFFDIRRARRASGPVHEVPGGTE